MKKLYYCKRTVDVCFVAETNERLSEGSYVLRKKAYEFLEKEAGSFEIKEVFSKADIPEEWFHALVYGVEEEQTVLEYLKDPEYVEYLRLKEKFER